MAGLTGYLCNEQQDFTHEEKEKLEKKMEKIAHRGKGEGMIFTDACIQIGFFPSHTNEILENYYENDRYLIVFDGDIYNQDAVYKQIENKYNLKATDAIAKQLLYCFMEKQEQLLDKLRGTFSMLIWDKEREELFGARDRFGVKPFYISETASGIAFASEKKGLYYDKRGPLNHMAWHHYFSYQYVPEPFTMQETIYKLEAGHYFYVKPNQQLQIKAYWKPGFTPSLYTFEEQVKRIRNALQSSVALHMQSDKKVGAFLSGGIDSSVIVAIAKEVNPSIETVTVGFERAGFSEIDIAQHTAEQLNVTNHHHVIGVEEFIEKLPEVIHYMDDPVADPASVPLYIAAREAKKYMDVVLSGEGADELFGGYTIYREPNALKVFKFIPKSIQMMLRKLAEIIPEGVRGKSFIERGTSPLEERYIGNANLFTEKEKALLLKTFDESCHYKKITGTLYEAVEDYADVHKMQYIDMHTWLRGDILTKADRMTMAHSLELRTPFLDKKLFDIAAGLVPEDKIAKGTTKYILREAIRGIVPDSVLPNRKLGFPVPIRHWLREELYDWAKGKINRSATERIIDKKYILDLLEKHRLGKVDYSRKIWAVLVFIIWYEMNMEA